MNVIAIQNESLFEMTLKATVIYDDFDFATRAAALLERVAVRVHEAIMWEVKPWRLDLLKQAALAETAVVEAADADLLVFALSQTHLPPAELLLWLEDWGGRRRVEDTAVMLLTPGERAAATPFWHELKEFAARQGLAFLSSHEVREDGDSMRFIHQLWERRQPGAALELLADSPQPTRHWGLNE